MPALIISSNDTDGISLSSPALGNPITVNDGVLVTNANNDAIDLYGGTYSLTINGYVGTAANGADAIRLREFSKGTSNITIGETAEITSLNNTNFNGTGIFAFQATNIINMV
jgi:hypothetical protein